MIIKSFLIYYNIYLININLNNTKLHNNNILNQVKPTIRIVKCPIQIQFNISIF